MARSQATVTSLVRIPLCEHRYSLVASQGPIGITHSLTYRLCVGVPQEGFEPPTFGFEDQHSDPLSY